MLFFYEICYSLAGANTNGHSGKVQIYFRIKYNRSKVISTFVIQLYGRMFHRLKFREIVAAQIYIALQDTPQRQQECIEL